MRFLTVAVLGFVMIAGTCWAQSGTEPAGGSHNFGRITCPQPVPCPGSADASMSSSALASQASACVTQYFGYGSPSGFFDAVSGLDAGGCLAPIPNIIPKGLGSQLVPSCCVVKLPTGNCAFRCELNTAS